MLDFFVLVSFGFIFLHICICPVSDHRHKEPLNHYPPFSHAQMDDHSNASKQRHGRFKGFELAVRGLGESSCLVTASITVAFRWHISDRIREVGLKTLSVLQALPIHIKRDVKQSVDCAIFMHVALFTVTSMRASRSICYSCRILQRR